MRLMRVFVPAPTLVLGQISLLHLHHTLAVCGPFPTHVSVRKGLGRFDFQTNRLH